MQHTTDGRLAYRIVRLCDDLQCALLELALSRQSSALRSVDALQTASVGGREVGYSVISDDPLGR